jgi:hypothetical protein
MERSQRRTRKRQLKNMSLSSLLMSLAVLPSAVSAYHPLYSGSRQSPLFIPPQIPLAGTPPPPPPPAGDHEFVCLGLCVFVLLVMFANSRSRPFATSSSEGLTSIPNFIGGLTFNHIHNFELSQKMALKNPNPLFLTSHSSLPPNRLLSNV